MSHGVAYFLLIYYSQVVGLDPALAGFALLLALVVDAVSDPLVGRWSDHIRTRLGRRHPVPLCVDPADFRLLLLPVGFPRRCPRPARSCGCLAFTIGLRLSLTMHSVPFNALLPELAPDYDDRTRLSNYFGAAAWFFGTFISVAMYGWWLADSPEYPDGAGVLRRSGYEEAGLVAAVAVCVCLAAAAVATHGHIPKLAAAPRACIVGVARTLGNPRDAPRPQPHRTGREHRARGGGDPARRARCGRTCSPGSGVSTAERSKSPWPRNS